MAHDPGLLLETLDYEDRGLRCRGLLARPADPTVPVPGVLVFPTFVGLGPFARDEVRWLAGAGYAALAVDLYGEGRLASSRAEARAWMEPLQRDRAALCRRGRAAFDALARRPDVEASRVGAVGYCFGGAAALELALDGAALRAVATLHGILPEVAEADAARVRASLQVHHGHADPLVPPDRVDAFLAAMEAAGVDFTFVVHGGARHGFTNPEARDPERGVVYHPDAARRARRMTAAFLAERLGPTGA